MFEQMICRPLDRIDADNSPSMASPAIPIRKISCARGDFPDNADAAAVVKRHDSRHLGGGVTTGASFASSVTMRLARPSSADGAKAMVLCGICIATFAILTGCGRQPAGTTGKNTGTVSELLSSAVRNADDAVSRAASALGLDEHIESVPPDRPPATSRSPRASVAARPPKTAQIEQPKTLPARGRSPAPAMAPSLAPPAPIVWSDLQTYSSTDEDVEPPRVSEELLASLRTLGVPGTTNTIELLVTADGQVNRVRLLSPPHQLPDMMVLGATKTWQLEPAMRHGRAVTYRFVVSWIAER